MHRYFLPDSASITKSYKDIIWVLMLVALLLGTHFVIFRSPFPPFVNLRSYRSTPPEALVCSIEIIIAFVRVVVVVFFFFFFFSLRRARGRVQGRSRIAPMFYGPRALGLVSFTHSICLSVFFCFFFGIIFSLFIFNFIFLDSLVFKAVSESCLQFQT
jgi:hypothetical protein